MEKYKRLEGERQANENDDQLASALEKVILKYFPKSGTSVKVHRNYKDSIHGAFTLGKDKSEYANGIIHNDPLHHSFWLWFNDDGTYNLEWSQGNMVVKPENPYMVYGTLKTGMRNKKHATFTDVIKIVDNYFKKLPSIIKANKEKIHPHHIELFKSKKLI